MRCSEIDFVLPWVDGSDSEWQALYESYSSQEEKVFNNNGERFRDWGLLRFWFRGVEKFAPWVRRIHFITCGQCPPWLDLNHPSIHFVNHSDYIPSQYLPTFNSHVIENNIHRIEGLTECFVLFNDDVFLSSPVCPDDFFKNGLPRDVAIRSFMGLSEQSHIVLNDILLINRYLDFWASYRKNLLKWYDSRYGLHCIRNLFFHRIKDFCGLKRLHMANPYLKTTFENVWEVCGEELDETNGRRFRSIKDVNQYLFQYWQIVTGSFYPKRYNYGCYCVTDNIALIKSILSQRKREQICINDNGSSDYSVLKEKLQQVFESVFPEKSTFELY